MWLLHTGAAAKPLQNIGVPARAATGNVQVQQQGLYYTSCAVEYLLLHLHLPSGSAWLVSNPVCASLFAPYLWEKQRLVGVVSVPAWEVFPDFLCCFGGQSFWYEKHNKPWIHTRRSWLEQDVSDRILILQRRDCPLPSPRDSHHLVTHCFALHLTLMHCMRCTALHVNALYSTDLH